MTLEAHPAGITGAAQAAAGQVQPSVANVLPHAPEAVSQIVVPPAKVAASTTTQTPLSPHPPEQQPQLVLEPSGQAAQPQVLTPNAIPSPNPASPLTPQSLPVSRPGQALPQISGFVVGADFANLGNKAEGKDHSERNDSVSPKESSTSPARDAVTSYGWIAGKSAVPASEKTPEPGQAADQVAESIVARSEFVVREGHAEFHLHLEPPELGTVRIHLTATDTGISARLFVHEPGARQLLQSQLESLRQRLQQEGIAVGRFDVADNDAGSRNSRQDGSDASGGSPGLMDKSSKPPRTWRGEAANSRVVDVVV
ncbi:MAG TPA: flagellar hook-length control protein FliK [Gemmataceae bacterium]|nr:flagellar hook-length control protein FliK [Gemmataceae bacterium]